MSELKPCPFCGNEPHVECERGCVQLWCPNSDCPAFDVATGYKLTKAEAVTAWNTRIPDPRITRLEADRVELRAQLEKMTEHYVRLAGSGDCGFWDHEKEDEVIVARETLARIKEN